MNPEQLELVAEIVSAYVGNNSVPRADLPNLIASVSTAVGGLGAPLAEAAPELTPAVNPKKSVFPDYIVSLEDGKQYRTLKRHLGGLGLTPERYREKWSLPRDYPMVAESYAAKRSELAKKLGLGRKPAPKVVEEPTPAPEPVAATAPSEAVEAAAPEPTAEAPAKQRRGRAKKASAEPAAS